MVNQELVFLNISQYYKLIMNKDIFNILYFGIYREPNYMILIK